MTTTAAALTRDQFATACSRDNLHGRAATVAINGATLTGTLHRNVRGAVLLRLTTGDYYGARTVSIFDPRLNNLTPHVLQAVTIG